MLLPPLSSITKQEPLVTIPPVELPVQGRNGAKFTLYATSYQKPLIGFQLALQNQTCVAAMDFTLNEDWLTDTRVIAYIVRLQNKLQQELDEQTMAALVLVSLSKNKG